jgi:hypothetical protein
MIATALGAVAMGAVALGALTIREERHAADQDCSPDRRGLLNALLGKPGSIARLSSA